jgi:hypothetical protein
MPDLRVKTYSGGEISIKTNAMDKLKASLRGQVLTPESEQYNEARTIWNAMIDRRPALIIRCASASDVIRVVRFAGELKLLVAVRGGGHNIAGNAVCDGGMVIDLSPMKSVHVDPAGKTARAEPGVTLGEFDRDTQAFGLATPLGINSTTGVAGLTLGGGFGWLSRKLGLSIDNLISVDVVTAAGDLIRASETEHPDLFWGIRGGGGNFGIVTSFEFRLHDIGPEVLAGMIIHPLDAARDVLRFYRDFIKTTPEEFVCWSVMRKAPPLPFLPPSGTGRKSLRSQFAIRALSVKGNAWQHRCEVSESPSPMSLRLPRTLPGRVSSIHSLHPGCGTIGNPTISGRSVTVSSTCSSRLPAGYLIRRRKLP